MISKKHTVLLWVLSLLSLQYSLKGPEGAIETKIEINPRGVKIKANTVGFFIANDAEEVRRANTFCKVTSLCD